MMLLCPTRPVYLDPSILYLYDFAAAHNFTYNVISIIDEYSEFSEVEGGEVYLS